MVSFGQGDKDGGLEEMLDLTMHQCNLMVLRGNKFKLIQFNGNLPPLLYNIQDDPGESENLANNPAYASIMLELTQEALKHRMTFVDRGLAESMSSTTDGSRLVTITRRAHLLNRRAAGVSVAAKM